MSIGVKQTLSKLKKYMGMSSLKEIISHKWNQCIENKNIFFILSEKRVQYDANIPFIIRYLNNDDLKLKKSNLKRTGQFVDPFCLEYRRNEGSHLVVEEFDNYALLFNKFSVIDHHMILVPDTPYPQTDPLSKTDFQRMLHILKDIPSLVFYNCGIQSGASQPHKHIQIVPMYSFDNSELPIEKGLEEFIKKSECHNYDKCIFELPSFDFQHGIMKVDLSTINDNTSDILYAQYISLMNYLHLSTLSSTQTITDHLVDTQQSYNFLLTPKYMIIVPRSIDSYEGVNVNSLGFIGSLVVNNEKNNQVLEDEGPLHILKHVSIPKEKYI
ncbi:hypothetical protein WA158_005664 [Blastocystis sp. Blastoise]